MSSKKHPLPIVQRAFERLGIPTIMDRALAARFGSRYVNATAFAIDMDRIQRWLETEQYNDDTMSVGDWPFGWEVFLVQRMLLPSFGHYEIDMLDSLAHAVLERVEYEGDILGASWLFAVYDLSHRKLWPQSLLSLFPKWDHPRDLIDSLDVLWAHPMDYQRALAQQCLTLRAIPLSPTTHAQLSAWSSPAPGLS